MKKEHLLPVVVVVLGASLAITISAWAGAMGRIDVLMEEAVVREEATAAAVVETDATIASMRESFNEAAVEAAESAVALVEAQEQIDDAERAAESSFRRAEGLAADNPVLEQAIQEMRGDAIVTSMEHEEREAISAATILRRGNRIIELGGLFDGVTETLERERAANAALHAIKDQIIEEQQNALAPSFLRKILDMPEIAFGGLVVGVVGCLALCP